MLFIKNCRFAWISFTCVSFFSRSSNQITDIGVTRVAQSPIKRSGKLFVEDLPFIVRFFRTIVTIDRDFLILATQSVPRFIQEITDVYAKEGETAVFECSYSGNPTPGISNFLYNFKRKLLIIFITIWIVHIVLQLTIGWIIHHFLNFQMSCGTRMTRWSPIPRTWKFASLMRRRRNRWQLDTQPKKTTAFMCAKLPARLVWQRRKLNYA